MDDMNIRVHQLVMRPTVLAGIPQPQFTDPPPQLAPYLVLSAWMVIILRLSRKYWDSSVAWSISNDINRVLQCIKKAGERSRVGKWNICVPEVSGCGHRCTTKDITLRIARSEDYRWPDCKSLMEVRGFLGICGIVRDWGQKDFARHAKPLILLMKKDTEFVWGMDQKASMEDLKQ